MKAFPPGFPFVSRTPEPAPEPDPAAASEPIAEAAAESSLSPATEPEPQTPQQSCEPTHETQPEPAPERDPWPFRKRERDPAREPWPFRKREPERIAAAEVALPAEPIDAEPAAPVSPAPETEPAPVPLKIAAPTQLSAGATSPRKPAAPVRAMTAAAPAPPAKPVVTTERRKVKRDAFAAAALLRVDGMHGPPLKIELTDISIAGARFRAPHKLDIGEKAQIRVEVGPFRWTTRLRVIHCSPREDGGTTIGCAFLRTELLRPWPAAA